MKRRLGFPRAALVPLAAACALASGCASGARDVVPESRDVRVTDPAAAAAATGYVYVARRPLGVVALAEARGIADEAAARAMERLADRLDGCATELQKQGKLTPGAIRVVAAVAADGTVSGLNVKVSREAAANALLCVIAPVKLLAFPASSGEADAGARGLAIEATWGPPAIP